MERNVRLFYIISFLGSLRFFGALQIIYFAQVTGSYVLGMSLFAVTTVSQAIFEVPTGIYSDMIGRKYTTVISLIITATAIAFYASGISYWVLFVGSILEGVGSAFSSGNGEAFLHDTLKESGKEAQYSKYYSRSGSIQHFGFAMAALLGGFIATISFPAAVWLSVVSVTLAFVVSLFLIEPKVFTRNQENIFVHLKDSIRAFTSNPKLRLLTISKTISYSIGESSYQFSSAFLNTLWPLWAIGILKTAIDLFASVSYAVSDKVLRKFGALPIMTYTFITSRIVNGIAYGFPTIISPVLLALTALYHGIQTTAKSSLTQKEYTDKQRATMGSLEALFQSIGFAIVSIFIGFIADFIGPAKVLLLTQILLLPILFLYWMMFKSDRKHAVG